MYTIRINEVIHSTIQTLNYSSHRLNFHIAISYYNFVYRNFHACIMPCLSAQCYLVQSLQHFQFITITWMVGVCMCVHLFVFFFPSRFQFLICSPRIWNITEIKEEKQRDRQRERDITFECCQLGKRKISLLHMCSWKVQLAQDDTDVQIFRPNGIAIVNVMIALIFMQNQ